MSAQADVRGGAVAAAQAITNRPIATLMLATILLTSSPFAAAGPQHWGFGFGYLVTIEDDGAGGRVLCVYEPPLRVKDGPWLLRWRDASGQYADVLPGGLAVGDFWPQPMGKEYVVTIGETAEQGIVVRVYDPPETFSTRPWKRLGEVGSTRIPRPADARGPVAGEGQWSPPLLHLGGNKLLATAAGDILGLGRDQLIVLAVSPSGKASLGVYAPPAWPDGDAWTLRTLLGLNELAELEPALASVPTALAAGDFWGTGRDALLLGFGPRQVYVTLTEGKRLSLGRNQPKFTLAKPTIQTQADWPAGHGSGGPVVACDFLKDGFAYLATVVRDAPEMRFSVAPKQAERYKTAWVRPDETFAGAKLSGQEQGQTRAIMAGQRPAGGRIVAAGGGRVFGYISMDVDERKEKLWKPWQFHGDDDVEISFAHRTPVYRLGVPKEWQDGDWPWEPDEHFGWPHEGEEVTYEVHIKNNGRAAIPAGKVTLRAWVDAAERNADVVRGIKGARGQGSEGEEAGRSGADFTFTIDQPIPPFDPANPKYAVVPVKLKWPFALEQPDGWTWKRINVREIGERWLILRVEYEGDENERNDRYELALNSLLFRPVLRYDVDAPPHPTPEGIEGKPERKINTLAWRAPVVAGDPESKEYYGRKLADAVQCMWERSRTSDGQDVWQRIAFDSYRLYDPQGRNGLKPLNRADDWSFYEGPRENEHWLGLWGDYERFDAADGGAELHETGHLFHRIGDLYHYFIFPTGQRDIRLADGEPVQMYTYAWGLDSYCSGHAIIGEATCDLHRYIEGARYGLGWAWHKMLPERIRVRVLDRDGAPVPDAKLSLWLYPGGKLHSQGVTGPDGTWDPGLPGGIEGARDRGSEGARYRVFEPFNLKQWEGPALDALAQIFTVELPGYSDFMIWGAEDTHAHSRYTLMHESLRSRAGWTWDFKTLYKAGAPAPRAAVTAAVQGRHVTISMNSPERAAEYRVYRRWEPTYAFERLVDRDPAGHFADDLGAADWFTGGRYRAAYYVTEILPDSTESLPRRVYAIALEHVNSVCDTGDGRLLVSTNCGKAEPFGVLCRGTTPAEEFVKHFRFGHTAAKIVAARAFWPQRCYATLVASDLPDSERFFDLIQFDKPDRHEGHHPVVQTIADCEVAAFSAAAPFTVTIRPDADARAAINVGDWAATEEVSARIIATSESARERDERKPWTEPITLTLDKPLFAAGPKEGLHLRIEFGGGTPGGSGELRELRNPRGLATIRGDGGHEHIVIADTGNGRVVVWDRFTAFIAQWRPEDGSAFYPAAVAHSTRSENECYVLDRHADRSSRVFRLKLAGRKIAPVGQPLPVPVGDAQAGPEIGLAVWDTRDSDIVEMAVTDGERGSVLWYRLPAGSEEWHRLPGGSTEPVEELRAALGTFAGDAQLTNPTDVAFTSENGELRLYAVDGHNRIVRIR